MNCWEEDSWKWVLKMGLATSEGELPDQRRSRLDAQQGRFFPPLYLLSPAHPYYSPAVILETRPSCSLGRRCTALPNSVAFSPETRIKWEWVLSLLCRSTSGKRRFDIPTGTNLALAKISRVFPPTKCFHRRKKNKERNKKKKSPLSLCSRIGKELWVW